MDKKKKTKPKKSSEEAKRMLEILISLMEVDKIWTSKNT